MSDDNVVSLFGKKNDDNEKNKDSNAEFSFEEIMKMNDKKKKKMQEERSKHNKGVKRSYRLDR